MYIVYILYSSSLKRYYVGQTQDIESRLLRHNSGMVKSTKSGLPWIIIHQELCLTRSQAMILEKKIKKRGAQRFIESKKFGV
jgi:putative endonuclease